MRNSNMIRRPLPLLLTLAVVLPATAEEPERSYTISPNESIHVVQRKTNLLAGSFEVTAYPTVLQLNSRWTTHVGTAVATAYHLSETFALQGLFAYNLLLARETDLQVELREKANLQPESAPSILSKGYAILAMEMSPIYGKLGFYENSMLAFSLFLTVGGGVVDTAVQLLLRDIDRDDDGTVDQKKPIIAAAGLKPAVLVGAGFRVRLAESWMLRIEVRDLVYSARITHLNGCSKSELETIISSPVGPKCRPGKFDPVHVELDAGLGARRTDGSSETINQVSAYLGVSYLFDLF